MSSIASMNDSTVAEIDDGWILSKRPAKNQVDPRRPYAAFIEKERTPGGRLEDVITIFLTNRECPFKCLMCDLWKNTTDYTLPTDAVPEQIQWALDKLPNAKHIKLYNSGNFFDPKAIPKADLPEIANILKTFQTVIIENHPRLVDKKCVDFHRALKGNLQVAIGLETAHPQILERLNKHMTLEEFRKSVHLLTNNQILVRAFILLKPPFLNESDGVRWAKRSIDFAFDCGVECCVVIPTRGGNGALEYLHRHNHFSSPQIQSLEQVLEYGIKENRGRVFTDLWDIENIIACRQCKDSRKKRLLDMNLTQKFLPEIYCDNCSIP